MTTFNQNIDDNNQNQEPEELPKFISFLGYVIVIGGFLLYLLTLTGLWGYITYSFYNWFLLPLFDFLPQITYGNAIGIAAVFTIIGAKTNVTMYDPDDMMKYLNILAINAVIIFVLGSLVKLITIDLNWIP